MRVVTLPMSDAIPSVGDEPGVPALPIIPDAVLVKREGDSGWYSVHFKPVNRRWIMLYEFAPGEFLAHPNHSDLLRALPAGTPWNERQWKQWRIGESADEDAVGRVVELSTVPTRDASAAEPWTMDGKSVTRAAPVMRSRCGHVQTHDLRELALQR